MKRVIEEAYPSGFRKIEADALAALIQNHQSVVLIGMKRVGISNFLRFFLSHNETGNQIFVHVDLNDLIERNLSAFWTLLLTRLVDSVQRSKLSESEKRDCRKLFVQSIQLKDHFFTVESVRKVLEVLVQAGLSPTIFLLRFDRLEKATTPEFFSNLIGLHDAARGNMAYVFTSSRPLDGMGPVFTKDMYLPPANDRDMKIILETLQAEYATSFDAKTQNALITMSGGYVQYLQLAVIRLREDKKALSALSQDEQIILQSEELFESLTKKEKEILLWVNQGNAPTARQRKEGEYLWNTGMVQGERKSAQLFSPLFASYVGNVSHEKGNGKEFTKKEHLLFTYLKSHEGELCEREAIIDAVWSESRDLGVSDWAIDRLVARLRYKLRTDGSPYKITTIVTRGYKLERV